MDTFVLTDLDEMETCHARIIGTLRALASEEGRPAKRKRASPPKYMPSDTLTVKEAAAYLRLGESTLNNYRTDGGGPIYSKPCGRVLYDIKDLDAWREANKRKSTSVAVNPNPHKPPRRKSRRPSRTREIRPPTHDPLNR